jgi:putative membrane protein
LRGFAQRLQLWHLAKFDLFLEIVSSSVPGRTLSVGGQLVGNIAGLLLIALGSAMMALAITRFRQTARDIDSTEKRSDTGARTDITLAGILFMLGAALFVYLSYTVINYKPALNMR